jgi:hypothetical protein
MPDTPKIFTVQEAEACLHQVTELIRQLQALHESILKTNQELDDKVAKISAGNGYPIKELREQVEQLAGHQLDLVQAFESSYGQLEEIGCLLKDLAQGLVDFYAMRDGEMVFLCWRLGEEQIRFWHGIDEGFAGRQLL